ncbi:helix-turn-helix transcriptional regulator [Glycomyces xiaoerkulensis]|uniref:helix-turn-helix transcriptional regulator n=1 Tax=Glycomyces xiaoerkulensis TaxID=2038139 RepID=UPI000C2660F3|nr:response regulator transcription factor [Glycomyces xiaoerkulensis]
MLYDPNQVFSASIRPLLHRRGDITVDAGSPKALASDDDRVDCCLVALEAVSRNRILTDCRRPVFLITDREDGAVLRKAVSMSARGIANTHIMPQDLLVAVDRSMTDPPYYDPRLLRAALQPAPLLGARDAHELADHLTPREDDVLRRIVRGEPTSHMAAAMGVSVSTVRSHVQNVLGKLGVNSRLGAVAFAINYGLETVHDGSPQLSSAPSAP